MRLSRHFSLHEFTRSETAGRLGIDNSPDELQLRNLVYLALNLEDCRTACGDRPIVVTSGLRVPELNAKIAGSSDTSLHQFGNAADFYVPGLSLGETIERIAGSGVNFRRCIVEFGSWIHFEQYDLDIGAQGDVLTASGDRDNPVYRPA